MLPLILTSRQSLSLTKRSPQPTLAYCCFPSKLLSIVYGQLKVLDFNFCTIQKSMYDFLSVINYDLSVPEIERLDIEKSQFITTSGL